MAGGNLRRFDLNLLVALDALLSTRNVTRAGEQLSLTQSAMSGELRRLRQMFGDELLVRVGREYELTPLARELIEPVSEILSRIERTVDHRTSFDPATESRRFSIAMSDYAMLQLLGPLLRRVGTKAPGVSFEISPFRGDVPTMLKRGGIDLVIAPKLPLDDINSLPLFSDRLVCVVCVDHPDVGDTMTPELFEALPRLSFASNPLIQNMTQATDWPVAALAAVRGRPPVTSVFGSRADVTIESFVLAPFLVSGTRLVALVLERLAVQVRETARVKVLEVPEPIPDLTETMYWSALADSDPAHRWLRDTMSEVAADLHLAYDAA